MLGFWRGNEILTVFNFSGDPQPLQPPKPPAGGWRDLLSGADVDGAVVLGAYGMAWLKAQRSRP